MSVAPYDPQYQGQPPPPTNYGQEQPVIQAQPGQAMAMPVGAAPGGVPPGLEPLLQVEQLFVKQDVELLEAFTGYETNNKYNVMTSSGHKIYLAAEDTCCCTRNCMGSERPFTINLMNPLGAQVMRLEAPCRCDSCFCPCCLRKVEVEAPPGNVVGIVKQGWSICKPKYYICNSAGDTMLRIEGPCCPTWELCGERLFQVYTADGETPCGQITKQWSGIAKEFFTDADNFGITFPRDLDVTVKATIIGACFLIDFMYFEKGSGDDDSPADMVM